MKKLLFIILLFGLAGCDPADRFSVIDAPAPVMNGYRSVHGKLTVESRARCDLMVESATIVLNYKERQIASARLILPILIPAGKVSSVRWDFALENISLTTLATLSSRLMADPGQFTVDVNGWVRWGGFRKKIELDGVSLAQVTQILSNFGTL